MVANGWSLLMSGRWLAGAGGTSALLGIDATGLEGAAALEGDGTITFEDYCAIVRKAEPNGAHTDESLHARFDAIDEDGSGSIDRREYVRGVLLERLSMASNRCVRACVRVRDCACACACACVRVGLPARAGRMR